MLQSLRTLLLALCALALSCAGRAQLDVRTRRSEPHGPTLRAFAAGGGRMIAAGDGGTVLVSIDGQAWTRSASGTSRHLRGATHGDGKFVLVGDDGQILVSTDGSHWTGAASSATDEHLRGVTYGKGRFVAVGDYGAVVSSTDGDMWTRAPHVTFSPLHTVLYGYGSFFAGGPGGILFGSTDGTHWSDRSVRPANDVNALTRGAAGLLAVGSGEATWGGGIDGFTWGTFGTGMRVNSSGWPLRGVASGGGLIVACGDRGTVLTVGATQAFFTAASVPTTINLHAVGFAQDTFVFVGDNETILQSQPVFVRALPNISVRAEAAPGERTLISGFVIRGTGPKQLLLRAAGPALTSFEVSTALQRPTLTLFNGAGDVIAANAGWAQSPDAERLRAAARSAGAFPFAEGSRDCALAVTLTPGVYTAHVTSEDHATGVALFECYDLDPSGAVQSRLSNVSIRAHVGAGENVVIPGFNIFGGTRTLLIRAVGPTLAEFGVAGVLRDPRFRLHYPEMAIGGTIGMPSSQRPPPSRWFEDWNTALDYSHALTPDDTREAAREAGAFPLREGAKDAAVLTTLWNGVVFASGGYSVEVASGDGTSGVALIEIYDVTDP